MEQDLRTKTWSALVCVSSRSGLVFRYFQQTLGLNFRVHRCLCLTIILLVNYEPLSTSVMSDVHFRGTSRQERQEATLEEKTSTKLDEAIADASARAPAMKSVDACFVMDCTRSMATVINQAKEKVREIQKSICNLLGQGGNVRFAIVAYRDHQYRKNIEVLPLTRLCCTSLFGPNHSLSILLKQQ